MSTIYGTRLSRRETEVLHWVSMGFSTRDIAERLLISENTVSNHRKRLLKKRGAKTCKELQFDTPKPKLIYEAKNHQS